MFRNLSRFVIQAFGLTLALTWGLVSYAATHQNELAKEEGSADQSSETLEIEVRSQKEVNQIYSLIDALNLNVESGMVDGSKLKLKMPKDHVVRLAGQIWVEK